MEERSENGVLGIDNEKIQPIIWGGCPQKSGRYAFWIDLKFYSKT
jgi:hypothetical protein